MSLPPSPRMVSFPADPRITSMSLVPRRASFPAVPSVVAETPPQREGKGGCSLVIKYRAKAKSLSPAVLDPARRHEPAVRL